jgi:quercetin dioxygenase-like cupin family protein
MGLILDWPRSERPEASLSTKHETTSVNWQVVAIREFADAPNERQHTILVKTGAIEVHHFVIPAGDSVPTHQTQGEIIVHCLKGSVQIDAQSGHQELHPGEMLYLKVDDRFTLRAITNTSLLTTLILPQEDNGVELMG